MHGFTHFEKCTAKIIEEYTTRQTFDTLHNRHIVSYYIEIN